MNEGARVHGQSAEAGGQSLAESQQGETGSKGRGWVTRVDNKSRLPKLGNSLINQMSRLTG